MQTVTPTVSFPRIGEEQSPSYMTQRCNTERRSLFSRIADCDTMGSLKDVMLMNIMLERVTPEKRDTLFRLLQYSLFEESMTDLNEMNDDALFDYPWFDAYFAETQREAYFIRAQDSKKLLGFAMVREHEDGRHSIAEFMVIPKYRRSGIGSQAAKACFARHAGLWEVKPAYGSESARQFWQKTIAQVTDRPVWKDGMFTFVLGNEEEQLP